MRRLGAHCSAVLMKRGNARGAKGAGYRHCLGPTGNGRSPMRNGRLQPSRDGTSRMTRECQVRFCERLGVKFPGPTRQNPNPSGMLVCQLSPAPDIPAHSLSAAMCPIGDIRQFLCKRVLAKVQLTHSPNEFSHQDGPDMIPISGRNLFAW
jgi:hypothetical protein